MKPTAGVTVVLALAALAALAVPAACDGQTPADPPHIRMPTHDYVPPARELRDPLIDAVARRNWKRTIAGALIAAAGAYALHRAARATNGCPPELLPAGDDYLAIYNPFGRPTCRQRPLIAAGSLLIPTGAVITFGF